MKYFLIILLFVILPTFVSAKVTCLSDYRGWKDCYSIKNEKAEVILCPAAGGRILYYAVNGKNIIFEDPDFNGYLLDDFQKDRKWPDGGRFDIGPESIPGKQRDELFMGEWDYTILNDNTVELFFTKNNNLGLHIRRVFRLDEISSNLSIKQTAINYEDKKMQRHFWGRYFCKGGGKVSVPFVTHNVWGFMGKEKSDKVEPVNDVLCYNISNETIKVGSSSTEGWISYELDGLKFTVDFKVYPTMNYSSTQGFTTIFYTNGKLCEIETVSPLYDLSPGDSFIFEQVWSLYRI